MTKRLVLALLTCVSLLALAPAAGAVELTKLGSTPAQGEAQSEIAAYHPKTEQAFVTNAEVFDTKGNHLRSFPAGSLPDMLTFTEHDKYLLVANEGGTHS